MKNTMLKLIVLVSTSTFLFTANADIAFSGSSVNSLSISTERSEDDKTYYLKIYIDGMETSKVKIKAIDHKIYLTAQNGGSVSGNAYAGGQFVNYSYSFNNDTDMQNLTRVDLNKLITLKIPKVHNKKLQLLK